MSVINMSDIGSLSRGRKYRGQNRSIGSESHATGDGVAYRLHSCMLKCVSGNLDSRSEWKTTIYSYGNHALIIHRAYTEPRGVEKDCILVQSASQWLADVPGDKRFHRTAQHLQQSLTQVTQLRRSYCMTKGSIAKALVRLSESKTNFVESKVPTNLFRSL